jgi:hypothetical protein
MSHREIQVHISDALEQWADIMNKIDANQTAYLMHYKDKDLLNAIYIFEHILSNIAIHKGIINPKTINKAVEMDKDLREYVKKYTGLDTHVITKQ